MMLQFRRRPPTFTGANQHGLTLVEVLVTAVIMSVGLLGIAALHLTSLRNGYDSNSRSRATWLANDIADHMRANALAARAGNYDIALGTSITTATDTATTDLAQWKNQLDALLHGDGSISRTTIGSDQVVTIQIQWKERVTDTSLSPTTFVMQMGI